MSCLVAVNITETIFCQKGDLESLALSMMIGPIGITNRVDCFPSVRFSWDQFDAFTIKFYGHFWRSTPVILNKEID